MSLTFHSVFRKLYTEPSLGASYHIAVHFATRFQRRRFIRNQPIRNKNCLWWACLRTDQDEMNNLHRRPSIDAFYQDSVHFPNRFQRRRILKISQWETRITWGGHAWKWIGTKWAILKENLPYNVDAYYQVSDHLSKRFQRRRLFWNEPIRYKNCLGWPCLLMDPDEMSNNYRGSPIDTYFLRGFGSFGQLVSFEKNLKNPPITKKIACGGQVC